MPWQTNIPRGDLLPLNETPRFQANWAFIETELQDDHFFDEDANNDGHHKKVEVQDLTDAIGAASVDANGDPSALSAGMTGYFYGRPKTATEAPTAQKTEPFFMTAVGGVNHFLQLGFRAMVNFTGRATNGACTINYAHNVSGVQRSASGIYVVTYGTALPTANYIPLIGAIRNEDGGPSMLAGVLPETSFGTNMTTTTLTLRFSRGSTTTSENPIRGWVAIVGG